MEAAGALLCLAGVTGATGAAHAQSKPGPSRAPLYQHDLPDLAIKGWSVTAVEVKSAPGQASGAHRHPGLTFAFVLEGEVVSKVGDGPRRPTRSARCGTRRPTRCTRSRATPATRIPRGSWRSCSPKRAPSSRHPRTDLDETGRDEQSLRFRRLPKPWIEAHHRRGLGVDCRRQVQGIKRAQWDVRRCQQEPLGAPVDGWCEFHAPAGRTELLGLAIERSRFGIGEAALTRQTPSRYALSRSQPIGPGRRSPSVTARRRARRGAARYGGEIWKRLPLSDRYDPRHSAASLGNDHLAALADIIQQTRQVLTNFSNASGAHGFIVSHVAHSR